MANTCTYCGKAAHDSQQLVCDVSREYPLPFKNVVENLTLIKQPVPEWKEGPVFDPIPEPIQGELELNIPVKARKECRTCIHREKHRFNNTEIMYCGLIKSNLTRNGKLKIKCKTTACSFHEETPKNE